MQKLFFSLGFLFFFGLNQLQAQHLCSETKQAQLNRNLNKANASSVEMLQMEKYDVYFHHLKLAVERTSTYVSGSVVTAAKSRVASLDTFVVQLHADLIVDSVLGSNRNALSYYRSGDIVYVLLAQSVQTEQKFSLEIFYHGTPPSQQSSAIGQGFSNRASPTYGNQITWSLSQPYSAYEWWPCKQSLQDKIDSVFVSVTTDTSNKVGSNGLLRSVENKGGGKHAFHWETRYPTDYYLVMVTVGQYNEYTHYAKPKNSADSILIQHYIYSNPAAYANNKSSIDAAKPQLELFSELFGLYPFHQEKYGHVMAPFSGGMEHQTMTSLGVFNFDIVAHELGHQWFGDNVTCATWKDIWLNEGFATYSEYLAAKNLMSSTYASNWLNDMHTEAKKGIGSVYVADTANVSRIFSSQLTYNKGGSAIRVLHHLLGDSLFFEVCKTYQVRFANGTASTEDFSKLVNELSGKNYDFFFEQWIYGAGYPAYQVRWNQIGSQLNLTVAQSNSQQSANIFKLPLPIVVKRLGVDSTIYVDHDALQKGYKMELAGEITSLKLDPENWILKSAVVVKDTALISSLSIEKSLQTLKLYPNPAERYVVIGGLENSSARVVLSNLLGETCLDKHISGGELVSLEGLKPGIYLVHVLSQNGQLFKEKLIIL